MLLYRGQEYGTDVGRWWSSQKHDADQFARAKWRNYVILSVDVDDEWAKEFHQFDADSEQGDWYNIPPSRLREEQAFAVSICGGTLSLHDH